MEPGVHNRAGEATRMFPVPLPTVELPRTPVVVTIYRPAVDWGQILVLIFRALHKLHGRLDLLLDHGGRVVSGGDSLDIC